MLREKKIEAERKREREREREREIEREIERREERDRQKEILIKNITDIEHFSCNKNRKLNIFYRS